MGHAAIISSSAFYRLCAPPGLSSSLQLYSWEDEFRQSVRVSSSQQRHNKWQLLLGSVEAKLPRLELSFKEGN